MSTKYWIRLSEGNILDCMRLISLHEKDKATNRLIKELNHSLRTIEETDKKHVMIFGKRGPDGTYKTNSFINGLKRALELVENLEDKQRIEDELERFGCVLMKISTVTKPL